MRHPGRWITVTALALSTTLNVPIITASFQPALAQTQTQEQRRNEALQLFQLGVEQLNKSQYQEALKTFQQALVIVREIKERQGEGAILHYIGEIYRNLAEYSQALDFYNQSLVIRKQVGDKAGEGVTLNSIASVYYSLGEYSKALDFYKQALAIAQQIGDKVSEGRIINNIGLVYDNLGQYSKALEFYAQSLVLSQKISDKAGELSTLSNIGAVYDNLAQYSKALEFYTQSLAIARQIGDKGGELTTLNNMGVVYRNQNLYSKALDSYDKALVLAREISNKAREGSTLNNIGAVYGDQGQYDKALDFYQQALKIRQEIGDKAGEGRTFNNMGAVYRDQGQYFKALEFYTQALGIFQKIGNQAERGITLSNIGIVYLQQKKYNEAEKTLFTAIEVFESLRPGLSDEQKVSIFETQAKTYIYLQEALVAQNKIDAALEIAERSRARAFVELLASKFSQNNNTKSRDVMNLVSIKPAKIDQIRQIAQQQSSTFVQYTVNESQLYIWVVKPTGKIIFKQVDLKALDISSITNIVNNSRESIGARGRGLVIVPTGEPVQRFNLKKLHQLLIEPIASLLPSNPKERVIFIPHESLFLVPFPALQDKDGKYLIEKHTILTSPAIQVLEITRAQRQKPKGKNVLVIGNPTMPFVGVPPEQLAPLEFAEVEAKAIARLENTTAITGSNATKATFKQKLPDAKIIHLATHGLLEDANKKNIPTAIALAPDSQAGKEGDNGLLTPAEILDLPINAELVVLSACDTGRGTITGDGVIGLSRSFITAGASSIIVSLWSVPDSPTSELMINFYQQLQQNPDKALALRQAMLDTIKKYPNPVNWAAFTLIGEAK